MEELLSVITAVAIIASVLLKSKKVSSARPRVNPVKAAVPVPDKPQETANDTGMRATIDFAAEESRQKAVPAVKPLKRSAVSVKELRRAVIMDEILQKPVSMRDR